MNGTTPALIAAAAGVGFGHAIMPDHWVPLAVVGRARRYPLLRVARLSGLAGIAHVLVSLLLGAVVVVIGLQFRSAIAHTQDAIVGGLLIATGLGFIALECSGLAHGHGQDHGHAQGHGRAHADRHGSAHAPGHAERHDPARDGRGVRGLAAIMVPFGAAASPDLTILPVFLAAAGAGAGTAAGSLVAFALVTIGTIVALTLLATAGGYQLRGRWLDRWGNAITAATLIVVGLLVLTGTI